MITVPNEIEAFLQFDDVVSLNRAIRDKTDEIILQLSDEADRVRALFEWVRDHIPHTKDLGADVVTCTSIEVFREGTGICFPKTHLLASMLRYIGVPCGFCYQIFEDPSDPDQGSLTLHGLNGIWLKTTGRWHRVDPRGNSGNICAEFSLDEERIAFPDMKFMDSSVYAVPLKQVVDGLKEADNMESLWSKLPSIERAAE